MKVLFKQACEIEGQNFGPDIRKKPREFDVPFYFVFVAYFVALFKDGAIKILDVEESEMNEEDIPKQYQDCEPDPLIVTVVEGILMAKEPKEEIKEEGGQDGKESSTASDSGDSASESSQGEQSESSEEQSSGQELSQGESSDQEVSEVKEEEKVEEVGKSHEQLEYEALHEKAKRLNNKEKKRYEELKTKLGIKG